MSLQLLLVAARPPRHTNEQAANDGPKRMRSATRALRSTYAAASSGSEPRHRSRIVGLTRKIDGHNNESSRRRKGHLAIELRVFIVNVVAGAARRSSERKRVAAAKGKAKGQPSGRPTRQFEPYRVPHVHLRRRVRLAGGRKHLEASR